MKYSICISGAASGDSVSMSCDKAYLVGKAIAEAGHVTTTGATVGLPFFGARGAVDYGGQSIGFSPASSLREHMRKYRLPTDVFDYINYTGMHYVGRDVYLVQSSDAVITLGGRFGSMHEFTTAIEAHMPCGVLLGTGGTADLIPELLDKLEEPAGSRIVFDTDPEALVKKVIALCDEEYADISDAEIAKHEDNFKNLVCGEQNTKRAG